MISRPPDRLGDFLRPVRQRSATCGCRCRESRRSSATAARRSGPYRSDRGRGSCPARHSSSPGRQRTASTGRPFSSPSSSPSPISACPGGTGRAGSAGRLVGMQLMPAPPTKSSAAWSKVSPLKSSSRLAEGAGGDERIEVLVVEEHRARAGIGLVAVVPADRAFAGFRVIGLADAGQEHQADIVQAVGTDENQVGRLEKLVARAVDIGHAVGASCRLASSSILQHFALGFAARSSSSSSAPAGRGSGATDLE